MGNEIVRKKGNPIVHDHGHSILAFKNLLPKENVPVVVLIGKLGSGKTTIFNILTGANARVQAGYQTVTVTAQSGMSRKTNLFVIDTPGLEETDNAVGHVAAQLAALQTVPISCILFVEKCARAGVLFKKLAEPINIIGRKELVSIIVTHVDTFYEGLAASKIETDKENLIAEVCRNLDIPKKVMMLGAFRHTILPGETPNTSSEDVISHVLSCACSPPIKLSLTADQVAKFHAICAVPENVEKMLVKCEDKLRFGKEFVMNAGMSTTTDMLLIDLMRELAHEVRESRGTIYRTEYYITKGNTDLIYWHTQARLIFPLAEFVKCCKSSLTYNIDDPSNRRNLLRKCPNCNFIWVKGEGGDGQTTCGKRPKREIKSKKWPLLGLIGNQEESQPFLGCRSNFEWTLAPTLSGSEINKWSPFTIVDKKLDKEIAENAEDASRALLSEQSKQIYQNFINKTQVQITNFDFPVNEQTGPLPGSTDELSDRYIVSEAQLFEDQRPTLNTTGCDATDRSLEWTCPVCTLSNQSDAFVCVVCETPPPTIRAPDSFPCAVATLSVTPATVQVLDDSDDTDRSLGWACPSCTFCNKGQARFCGLCAHPAVPSASKDYHLANTTRYEPTERNRNWTCPQCTFLNSRFLNSCEVCGASFPS